MTKLEGKAHCKGVYKCKAKPCREQFTVTVGYVMGRSHISLTKWAMAIQLMAASKKGISAKQIWTRRQSTPVEHIENEG